MEGQATVEKERDVRDEKESLGQGRMGQDKVEYGRLGYCGEGKGMLEMRRKSLGQSRTGQDKVEYGRLGCC